MKTLGTTTTYDGTEHGYLRAVKLLCERHGGMKIALFILTTGTDQLQIITIREIFFIERDALIHQRTVTAQQ